jgi:hypothetical protein
MENSLTESCTNCLTFLSQLSLNNFLTLLFACMLGLHFFLKIKLSLLQSWSQLWDDQMARAMIITIYLRILECVHALVSTKYWDSTLFAYPLCPLGNNKAMISSGKMCGCILHSIKQKTTNNELIQLVSSCSFHLPLQLPPNCGVQICSSIHLCIVRSWASVCHPVSLMWSFLV